MHRAPLSGGAGSSHKRRPRHEVADVFRRYGDDYRRSRRLPFSHLKVMRAVEQCRTAVLGGHIERCDACGHERVAYNSCRNRHCPKCQALAKAAWLEARRSELLPVPYFHNVFTIPHELNPLALRNKKVVYDILFAAASETLQTFAADAKRGLDGRLGFTAVLHTWDQRLRLHLHLHCVIAGGALSPDSKQWTNARRNFLFPVKALSKVFRGKFISRLRTAFVAAELTFPGRIAPRATEKEFAQLLGRLREKNWVVYSKAPFAGPEKVLDYLGRYTHRVAIANHRIADVGGEHVTFHYRDRADGNRRKRCTVTAEEFIRRFLLHVLPKSYCRIRHFGFLASRAKGRGLARCRELLGLPPEIPKPPERSTGERMLELTGVDLTRCPCCQNGTMHLVADLPPVHPVTSISGGRAPPRVQEAS